MVTVWRAWRMTWWHRTRSLNDGDFSFTPGKKINKKTSIGDGSIILCTEEAIGVPKKFL